MNALVGLLELRFSSLADSRDSTAAQRAMKVLLQYLRREPAKMHRVGPISLWLCGGYPFERVEQMMDRLVDDEVLRRATAQELKQSGYHQGYFVTAEGLSSLPPEDRSYGAI